ncbi:signal recognition particle subunit srp68, partial [Cryomyces antarcticus]
AYAASLSGAEEFEKQFEGQRPNDAPTQDERWQKCLAYYSEARVIYAALMRETKKDLFKEVLASTIDPSIRYAAYQSHLPRTTAVLVIAKRCFPRSDSDLTTAVEKLDPDVLQEEQSASGAAGKDSGSENVPNTINWRSRTANIADASIGQALAAVATAEAQLSSFLSSENTDSTSREKAAAYDEVLIASQDAADAT